MKKIITLLAFTFAFSAMASTQYYCNGTEPFWGFTVEQNSTLFSWPYDTTQTTENILSVTNVNGDVVVTTTSSKATITPGACNDGMTDINYNNSIVYNTTVGTLVGCCLSK